MAKKKKDSLISLELEEIGPLFNERKIKEKN
jgi:hypothetical protein